MAIAVFRSIPVNLQLVCHRNGVTGGGGIVYRYDLVVDRDKKFEKL